MLPELFNFVAPPVAAFTVRHWQAVGQPMVMDRIWMKKQGAALKVQSRDITRRLWKLELCRCIAAASELSP